MNVLRHLKHSAWLADGIITTQRRRFSSIWRGAELLVVGCPGCGYWRVHEAYLAKGYCRPPPTLHSEREDVKHTIVKSHREA